MHILKKITTAPFYQKLHLILILILISFLPFNAIIQVITEYKLQITWFNYFKEILIGIILIMNGLWLFANISSLKKILKSSIIKLTLGFIIFSLLSLVWINKDILTVKHVVTGFKYDVFLMIVLLIGISLPNYILKKKKKILYWMIGSNSLALGIGMYLHWIVHPENLTVIGFRHDWSTFISDQSLAFCQKIEHNSTCRFQGVFSGPNQAGANLLLLIGLLFSVYKKSSKKYIFFGTGILALMAMFFTYSRSTWLALIAFIGLFLYFALQVTNRKLYMSIFTGTILIVVGIITYMYPQFVVRMSSNSERLELMKFSVRTWMEHPIFGQGMGVSGPASHWLKNPFITENWLLQMAVNYGLIGLGIFMAWYYQITKTLLKHKKSLIWGVFMLSLLIPLNLLHYFEDSSFMYSLFLIIGLFIQSTWKQDLKVVE